MAVISERKLSRGLYLDPFQRRCSEEMQGKDKFFLLKYCKIILRRKICSKLLRAVRSKCTFVMCYVNKGFVYLFSVLMFADVSHHTAMVLKHCLFVILY